MTQLVPLEMALDAARCGSKAANLARLVALGLPVPEGAVVPAEVFIADARDGVPTALRASLLDDLCALVGSLGPVAVRSSGVAEDLEDASFAGQYETVLDVSGRDAMEAAVLHCWASAYDVRVAQYQERRGVEAAPLALLIQRMLRVESAGVAFTANPVTGARDEVVISAVPGVGETLVSGEHAAEEWIVAGETATRMRAPREALSPAQALQVAEMARRVERHFGVPQDVEWAFEDGALYVLQARPLTALPDVVDWTPPLPNVMFTRIFRLGEWLPEPVTPLFATLILPALQAANVTQSERWWGWREDPYYVVINGWVFGAPMGRGSMVRVALDGPVRGMTRHPKTTLGLLLMFNDLDRGKRWLIDAEEKRWREDRAPRYRARVERGWDEVESLNPRQLITMSSELADLAGEMFWSLEVVAGFAWKAEGQLAKMYAKRLRPTLGGSHQPLLCGLRPPTAPAAHAVLSLDPATPAMGELGLVWEPPSGERLVRLDRERVELEARCRDALPAAARERFDHVLGIARYYANARDEQVADVTIGWPLLRRALHRLGEHLVGEGMLGEADNIYYLDRAEIEAALAGQQPKADITSRVRERTRQRRLSPPLVVGKVNRFFESTQKGVIAAMRSRASAGESILGMPASPGRVTGPVRIVREPAEFDRLRAGEVLVAPTTSPAWTPLFARALAVVTDGGSVAAHASLVAREYGLPAVVAAEGATARLRDGMIVIVDGSAGLVELVG